MYTCIRHILQVCNISPLPKLVSDVDVILLRCSCVIVVFVPSNLSLPESIDFVISIKEYFNRRDCTLQGL